MNQPIIISKAQARKIAVYSSGLHKTATFGRGISAVVNAIRHLGYVQIDTISVVERAHHHVLWSRAPGYNSNFLADLQLNHKEIFEYWAHAAAYLPIEDYRYSLPKKNWFRDKKDSWPKSSLKLKQKVLERINKEGPLMARDFEGPKTKGAGWWDWKPAKLALERLFLEGDLMITHRKGFQKVYDLPERQLPDHVETHTPSNQEYARYLIKNAIRAFGLVSISQVSYLRQGMRQIISEELNSLVESGQIVRCDVKGVSKTKYFLNAAVLENKQIRLTKKLRLLSPFDNLLIQRNRVAELFDFNYQIECYVPRDKRVFGYFSLPMLNGDQFIGRADCKADRKTKILHIYNLVIEDKIKLDDKLLVEIQKSFREFASFNNCVEIELHRMVPEYAYKRMKPLLLT